MNITISGKHLELGNAFKTHVENRLQEGISKYSDRVNAVEVVVAKDSHRHRVDIHGNTGTHAGIVVKSSAESEDVYAAFDQAADKIEKQLRRYKRRLTNHHAREGLQGKNSAAFFSARKYVLAPEAAEELDEKGQPLVIAEKPTSIDTLSVSEAVMQMDLQHLPALMFFNSKHGGLNVVYRREDGNISWVDPEVSAQQQKAS